MRERPRGRDVNGGAHHLRALVADRHIGVEPDADQRHEQRHVAVVPLEKRLVRRHPRLPQGLRELLNKVPQVAHGTPGKEVFVAELERLAEVEALASGVVPF